MLSKQSLVNGVLPILICLFLLGAYLPKLMGYQLSGDDLILITGSPSTISEGLTKFIQFSSQYRPLTHNLFSFYRVLLPNTALILTVNFLLMCVIAVLTYFNLKRFCRPVIAAIITGSTFLSPIFYYHFFSVSSLNNILILLFGLLLLLLVQVAGATNLKLGKTKTLIYATVLVALSLLSKESFLVNGALYVFIVFQQASKKQLVPILSTFAVFVGSYLLLRFTSFKSVGEYSVRFSPSTMLKSLLDAFAWLAGYPRGWQYGAPEAKTLLTFITAGVSFLSLAAGLFFANPKKHRKALLGFFVLLGLSIAPFLIIERVLPFYFDVTLLVIVFGIVRAAHQRSVRQQAVVYALIVLSFVLQYVAYFPQWQRYSFVANANTTVQNYLAVLSKNNFQDFAQICITNHSSGVWGTMDGQAAKYLYNYSGRIVSEPLDSIPEVCRDDSSLVLRNDGWNFERISK